MKKLWHIIVGILLLAVAGFCVYGFSASFEPPQANIFKAIYGVGGGGCLLTSGWLFLRR